MSALTLVIHLFLAYIFPRHYVRSTLTFFTALSALFLFLTVTYLPWHYSLLPFFLIAVNCGFWGNPDTSDAVPASLLYDAFTILRDHLSILLIEAIGLIFYWSLATKYLFQISLQILKIASWPTLLWQLGSLFWLTSTLSYSNFAFAVSLTSSHLQTGSSSLFSGLGRAYFSLLGAAAKAGITGGLVGTNALFQCALNARVLRRKDVLKAALQANFFFAQCFVVGWMIRAQGRNAVSVTMLSALFFGFSPCWFVGEFIAGIADALHAVCAGNREAVRGEGLRALEYIR
jgi:hypothetical protein